MSNEDTQSFTLPSDPVQRKKISDALHEMAGALQFIEDKREFMKDVAASINEEFEIPKKIVMKMARTLHKHNYNDVAQETDVFVTCFETLFPTLSGDDSSEADAGE
jgi:hypothetical protein